ncbi:MAG: hypothetical protein KJ601_06835 [Nanoarchaeota archaeon]|nr:hypothetical protein [Nanoarchaeota archaeon]MBU1704404.1 hypothetical protein [Nanoarchaeota archaeon]
MIEVLKQIGLSEGEAKVYLALVNLKRSQPGKISQETGMHRRTVYHALEALIRLELIKKEQQSYVANDPKKLYSLIDVQQEQLDIALPSLKADYEASKDTQISNFFRGINGLKTILDDMIIKKSDIFVIGNPNFTDEYAKTFERFDSRRRKTGIKMRFVCTRKYDHIPIKAAQFRFLPEQYDTVSNTYAYANKIAIIHWANEPLIISIKLAEMTKAYKDYFDILWRIAKA